MNPAETCLITVDYDDGNEVCSSAFKTKGRHTVHKVLMTVCKTFGIEALYPRYDKILPLSDLVHPNSYCGVVHEAHYRFSFLG